MMEITGSKPDGLSPYAVNDDISRDIALQVYMLCPDFCQYTRGSQKSS